MDKLKTDMDELAYNMKKDSGNLNHEAYKRLEDQMLVNKTDTDRKFKELQKGQSKDQKEIINQLGNKIQNLTVESAEQRAKLEEIVGRELE